MISEEEEDDRTANKTRRFEAGTGRMKEERPHREKSSAVIANKNLGERKSVSLLYTAIILNNGNNNENMGFVFGIIREKVALSINIFSLVCLNSVIKKKAQFSFVLKKLYR